MWNFILYHRLIYCLFWEEKPQFYGIFEMWTYNTCLLRCLCVCFSESRDELWRRSRTQVEWICCCQSERARESRGRKGVKKVNIWKCHISYFLSCAEAGKENIYRRKLSDWATRFKLNARFFRFFSPFIDCLDPHQQLFHSVKVSIAIRKWNFMNCKIILQYFKQRFIVSRRTWTCRKTIPTAGVHPIYVVKLL